MKKIGVLTSGGDAPGMNAAVRAVVRTCIYNNIECYGIYEGYNGLINNNVKQLQSSDVSNIIQRGGTILRSSRSEEFRTVEGRKKAFENIQKIGLDGIVAIGGDGTFTGANIFNQEHNIPFVGIPGTIDNDLFGTDNTIGYDTALNTVVEAVDKIRDTASSHNRIFLVEVMGRDAGFLALRSGISVGAEAILIPETQTYINELILKLENGRAQKKSMIVIVAEGDDVVINPLPKIDLMNDTLICPGDNLLLNVEFQNATYFWQDGSVNSSLLINEPGSYWVTADLNSCIKSDTVNIEFYKKIPYLGKDTVLCDKDILHLDLSYLNEIYHWQDNSSSSFYNISEIGSYWITIESLCGVYNDSINVSFKDCSCTLYVPNSFTPNNDGVNDNFFINLSCPLEEFDFTIFNRFGEIIFNAKNLSDTWDGTYRGKEVPIDTYAYKLTYKSELTSRVYKYISCIYEDIN